MISAAIRCAGAKWCWCREQSLWCEFATHARTLPFRGDFRPDKIRNWSPKPSSMPASICRCRGAKWHFTKCGSSAFCPTAQLKSQSENGKTARLYPVVNKSPTSSRIQCVGECRPSQPTLAVTNNSENHRRTGKFTSPGAVSRLS